MPNNHSWRWLIILFAACAGWLPGQSVTVERSDGSRLTIDNYAEHQATALVFLSSRSPETRLAVDAIRAANVRYRRRQIMFTGIFPNPAESGEEILRFCQASGFVFPCYRDPSRSVARAFGVSVTPEGVLLDSSGKVIFKGGITELEKTIEDVIAKRPVVIASAPASGTPIDKPAPPLPVQDPYGTLIHSSELIFEKIEGAPVHHASSIAEASNGDLLVTWYGGSYESSDDEALFLARRKKGQQTWEPPQMLMRHSSAPVGNAVVFTDQRGRVWILWGRIEAKQPLLAHTGWERTRLFYRVSDDSGYHWSEDKLFPMDTTGWLPRNLPIKLDDRRTRGSPERRAQQPGPLILCPNQGWRRLVGQIADHPERAAAGRTANRRPAERWDAAGILADRPPPAANGILRSRNDLESRQAH